MNMLKHNDNWRARNAATTRLRQGFIPVFLTALLLATGWSGTVRTEELRRPPTSDADVGRLVEEVLRKAGGNDGESLGAWTRSIVERALERAGGAARQTVPGSSGPSAAPLPAERHAGSVNGGAKMYRCGGVKLHQGLGGSLSP